MNGILENIEVCCYLKQLVEKKDELNYTWFDIADEVNAKFGLSYNECTYRRQYKAVEEKLNMLENADDEEGSELAEKYFKLAKKEWKFKDLMTQANAGLHRLSREDTLIEIADKYAEKMNKEKLLTIPELISIDSNVKTAISNIGDWHYGLKIDNYWNKFDTDTAKQRVTNYTIQTIVKCKANNVKRLIINGLGDFISGLIHLQLRIYNQEDVISQVMDVCEIIAEMLTTFSQYFQVEFYSVFGNHARINPIKKESIQLENFERLIPWYLKKRLQDNKNVKIVDNEFDDDIIVYEANGFTIGAVHGDKDNVASVVKNLTLMTNKKFDLVITAHKHHFAAEETNQCIVISNPSLCGVDDFAKDLRATSTPAQTLIILGDKSPIETIYYIALD